MGPREGTQPSHLRTNPCKDLQDVWEVSQSLPCCQELGPGFVLQKSLVNHVEFLALGRMELAQIPRGIKRGFVVCEWLPGSLSSLATPAGANGPAIPAAFLPKLLGPGRAGGWDRCSGVKNAPVQRVWRDHHDPHLGYPSGRSGNLNSALALCLGIIRSRKSEALSRGGS